LTIRIAKVARVLRLLLVIGAVGGGVTARAAPDVSSGAEGIYAAAAPRLLQIRTLLADGDRQASIGSGFLVSPDGLAITNYHVVSQAALEPKTYRLEYAAADGSRGGVSLLGIDLPNDLAIIRLDKHDAPFFAFDETAMARGLPKGERLYSMGNPLDLGFTVNEGTYNGLVGRSYNERIHFTGALNPDRQCRRPRRRRQRCQAKRRRTREFPRAGALRQGSAAAGARARGGAGLPRRDGQTTGRVAVRALQIVWRRGISLIRSGALPGAGDDGVVVQLLGADQYRLHAEAAREH
jgi:hypothetical protein